MTAMLDFELGSESLERSKVDLVVAGFFCDQQPLRGGAGRVDWRLCGLVSEQILAGRISGAPGDALLVPSSGQLCANNVLLVGLGERGEYRLREVSEAMQGVVSRALRLASPSVALAPLGIADDEFSRCAEAIIAGAVTGFADSAISLRLRVVLPANEVNRGVQSVDAAIAQIAPENFRFKRPTVSASPRRVNPHGYAAPRPGSR